MVNYINNGQFGKVENLDCTRILE